MLIRSTLALLLIASAEATTTVARVFADHMVLQRSETVAIFGHDDPGQKVVVKFAGQSRTAITAVDGRWQADLAPLAPSANGRELEITGSTSITVRDVLVGEVWLAAGQSNMNFQVKDCSTKPDPKCFPLIRMANWEGCVGTTGGQIYGPADYQNLTPQNHYTGTWQTLDEKSVRPQSGVAYFFANALARELKVPVGIVDISLGGTTAEAFIAPAVLRRSPYLAAAFEDPRQARTLGQWATARIAKNLTGYVHDNPKKPYPHPFAPGFLHATAMPHLVPFTFKGVIWYQGESNTEFTTNGFRWNGERLANYQAMVMKTLVDSWRAEFHQPAMPFYMVELPRTQAPNRALWTEYREAQQRAGGSKAIAEATFHFSSIPRSTDAAKF